MSRSLNKVQLIGHVGKDPEYTYTSGGTAVATFRLATSESWKDKKWCIAGEYRLAYNCRVEFAVSQSCRHRTQISAQRFEALCGR